MVNVTANSEDRDTHHILSLLPTHCVTGTFQVFSFISKFLFCDKVKQLTPRASHTVHALPSGSWSAFGGNSCPFKVKAARCE